VMKKLLSILILLAAGALLNAQAATYEGVTLPDSAIVGGKTLVLNGMGLREKFFFHIYVGGLYLPEKTTTPDAVLAEQGPYRVVMHMLYDVSHSQFTDAWLDDIKANNKSDYASLENDAKAFAALFSDSKKGDEIFMDYVPGTGVSVSYDGTLKGTIKGDTFAKALLRVYMGPHPPTKSLQRGMLGKS
ncbi:MAG: chalcone isomerase family protein, partial [Gammaproteobacteria bacterium]